MEPITWRISRLLMPWPTDEEPLIEVTAIATWEEMTLSHKVMPAVECQFWLPAHLRDLTEIEQAAYAYIREHLPPVGEALPPA